MECIHLILLYIFWRSFLFRLSIHLDLKKEIKILEQTRNDDFKRKNIEIEKKRVPIMQLKVTT